MTGTRHYLIIIFVLSAVAVAAIIDAGTTRRELQSRVIEEAMRDFSGFSYVSIPVTIEQISSDGKTIRYSVRSKKLGTIEVFEARMSEAARILNLSATRDTTGAITGFVTADAGIETIQANTSALAGVSIGRNGEILVHQLYIGSGIPAL